MTRRQAITLAAAALAGAEARAEVRRFRVGSERPARIDGVPDVLTRVEYTSAVDGAADWVLVRRPDAGVRDWIVNIHGHGSHGDQLFTRPDIRDQWLPEFRRAGYGILAPNLRDNAWMSPAASRDLRDLLRWARERQGARRFLLVGGSMGGSSVLAYAAVHPDDAAAVVALCPASDIGAYHVWCLTADQPVCHEIARAIESAYGGAPAALPKVYAERSAVARAARLRMPVAVVHGSADAVIPVTQSRALSAAMGTRASFRYEEVAGGGHDTPLAALPRALAWVAARM